MNPYGTKLLRKACPEGRDWAMRFDSIAEVWEHCPRFDWMTWLLDAIDISIPRDMHGSCKKLRAVIPNPFKARSCQCEFCVVPHPLSAEEFRLSQLVGSQLRCAEYLKEVGLSL